MSRDDRMHDESVSHNPLAKPIIDYVKSHSGCTVSEVLDNLDHLDYRKGGVSMLRAAMIDMMDTGELEGWPSPGIVTYIEDPAKRHGRWA